MTQTEPFSLVLSREVSGVLFIDVPSKITKGKTAAALTALLKTSAESGKTIGVNLEKTELTDTSLISSLVSLWKKTRPTGGRVYLVKPSPFVLDVLNATQIARVFPIVHSENQLLKSLGKK